MFDRFSRMPLVRWGIPAGLTFAGIISIFLFGVLGVARGHIPWHHDYQVLYGSGAKLLRGLSPYGPAYDLPEVAAEGVRTWIYAYPPNFSAIILPLSAMGYSASTVLVFALNLLATASLAMLVSLSLRCRAFSGPDGETLEAPFLLGVGGAILASPFVTHVMWLGNTTTVVSLALFAGWIAVSRNRSAVAGLLLAFAAIKPQLVVLPGLWLLLERRFDVIGWAALGSLGLSSYAMWVFGPIGAFTDWVEGLIFYMGISDNHLGCLYCFGVSDMFATFSLRTYIVDAFALIGFGWVWVYRDGLTRLEILALLSALTVLFLPVHNYDLIVLAPFVGAWALQNSTTSRGVLLALFTMVVFFVPLRLMRELEITSVIRWREVLLIGLMIAIMSHARRRHAAAAAELRS